MTKIYAIKHTKNMKKIFLYLSAFIPLYCLIIIKLLIEIINNNLTFNVLNSLTLCLLTLFILLGILGLVLENKNCSEIMEIKIIQKKSITQQHFLGYFSLFVLFALTFELEKISMFVIFLLILTLIGIVYIKNDLFYINPFLNILGYNFYDIKYKDKDGNIKIDKFYFKGKLENKNYIVKKGYINFNYIYRQDNEK